MVVSLKANRKRIMAFLILAAVVIGACIFLRGGKEKTQPEVFPGGSNEERVAFLTGFGWEVDPQPVQTREVMIPAQFDDVYTAYNVMQQAQGFELKPYAGEICTQYQYKINNYPGETEVYATLLVYGDVIIGGDVACAELDGFMHGFAKGSAYYGETSGASGRKEDSASSAPAAPAPSEVPQSSVSAADMSTSSLPAESGVEDADASAVESEPESAVESAVTETDAVPEDAYPTD